MKTILITGGLGYIGSHTAVVFANAGYDIVIVDNLSNSDISVLDKINSLIPKPVSFYECDLRDKDNLSKVFETHKIDGVIHFAAFKAVGESCELPFKYYNNNVICSLCLFELMSLYNVNKIVFSSTATIYDSSVTPPFVETDRLGTTNPYATTKLIIESILKDLSSHKGFNTICLRYFNPIGAHPSGKIGENPNGIPNNLLPFIFKVTSGKLSDVKVFGNDYSTSDGTGIRDYIHIMDLVEAHVIAYEKSGLSGFETFNIGTGQGTSVLEIIDSVKNITQKEIPYTITSRRAGDVALLLANPDKAHIILGWKASRNVEDAIRDGRNFIQNLVK